MKKIKEGIKAESHVNDIYFCERCEISSLTERCMCPCPRGGCEAEIIGEIRTTIVTEIKLNK